MNGTINKMILKDGREQPYVFVTGEDNKQYFLHQSNFLDGWSELSGRVSANTGVKVRFDKEETPKGPRAANCMFLENTENA